MGRIGLRSAGGGGSTGGCAAGAANNKHVCGMAVKRSSTDTSKHIAYPTLILTTAPGTTFTMSGRTWQLGCMAQPCNRLGEWLGGVLYAGCVWRHQDQGAAQQYMQCRPTSRIVPAPTFTRACRLCPDGLQVLIVRGLVGRKKVVTCAQLLRSRA